MNPDTYCDEDILQFCERRHEELPRRRAGAPTWNAVARFRRKRPHGANPFNGAHRRRHKRSCL